MKTNKLLVVATSHKTRGGITSVVKAHQTGYQWGKYKCKWIETHIDKSVLWKLWYFFVSIVQFIVLVPFSSIVHIHFSEPASAIRKVPFILLSKLFNKKIILHFHSFSPETTLYSKFARLYKFIFKQADRFIVLSEYWKKELVKFLPTIQEVTVLLNPCYAAKIENVEKCKYILFAGTVNERKGYADLIKAFSRIANKYPLWKLVIAGNGEIETANELCLELGISKQVEMRGWVSGKDKDLLFAQSSIFCLPSYAEGLPMALLDAWAYGLPCIVTPVGGIPDVAIHRENALIFPAGDIDKLSIVLEELVLRDHLREQLSKASLQLSIEKFSISNISNGLDKIYSEVLSN